MISKYIDYIDDPNDTMEQYWEKGIKYNVRCVFTDPENYEKCKEYLKDTDIIVAGAVDFPEGIQTLEEKLADFEKQYEAGIREIDYVLNQKAVETRDYDAIEKEITTIATYCRERGIVDKCIVEFCKMDGDVEAKKKVIEIGNKAKPCFLKTSTGRSFKGADIEDVKLMKSILDDDVKIKAAGGIKTYEQAKAFVDAGASALGASAAIAIIEGEK